MNDSTSLFLLKLLVALAVAIPILALRKRRREKAIARSDNATVRKTIRSLQEPDLNHKRKNAQTDDYVAELNRRKGVAGPDTASQFPSRVSEHRKLLAATAFLDWVNGLFVSPGDIVGLALHGPTPSAAVFRDGEFRGIAIPGEMQRVLAGFLSGDGDFNRDDGKRLKEALKSENEGEVGGLVVAIPQGIPTDRRNRLFKVFSESGLSVRRFFDPATAAAVMWTYAHPGVEATVLLRDESSSSGEAVVFIARDGVCEVVAHGTPESIRDSRAYSGDRVSREEVFSTSRVRRGAALQAAGLQNKSTDPLLLDCTADDFGVQDGNGVFHPLLEANTTIPTLRETTLRLSSSGDGAGLTLGARTADGLYHAISQPIVGKGMPVSGEIGVVVEVDTDKVVSLSLWDKASGHALCACAIDPRRGMDRPFFINPDDVS